MLRLKLLEAGLIAGAVSFSASYGYADDFSARLSGFNEIGSIPSGATYAQSYTGAVLTDATGTLHLDLDKKKGTIDYTLPIRVPSLLTCSRLISRSPPTPSMSQHTHSEFSGG
jgi:hypothetical protein